MSRVERKINTQRLIMTKRCIRCNPKTGNVLHGVCDKCHRELTAKIERKQTSNGYRLQTKPEPNKNTDQADNRVSILKQLLHELDAAVDIKSARERKVRKIQILQAIDYVGGPGFSTRVIKTENRSESHIRKFLEEIDNRKTDAIKAALGDLHAAALGVK